MSIFALALMFVLNGILGNMRINFLWFLIITNFACLFFNNNFVIFNCRGFPVWLKYVPGISFRTDNEPFKVKVLLKSKFCPNYWICSSSVCKVLIFFFNSGQCRISLRRLFGWWNPKACSSGRVAQSSLLRFHFNDHNLRLAYHCVWLYWDTNEFVVADWEWVRASGMGSGGSGEGICSLGCENGGWTRHWDPMDHVQGGWCPWPHCNFPPLLPSELQSFRFLLVGDSLTALGLVILSFYLTATL